MKERRYISMTNFYQLVLKELLEELRRLGLVLVCGYQGRKCHVSASLINLSLFFYLLVADERKFQTLTTINKLDAAFLTVLCRKWCPWFSCRVTECEAGWMCGLARGQTGAET